MHISETLSVSLVELSFKYFCAVGPFTKVLFIILKNVMPFLYLA